jgi:hypothetical protein
MTIETHNLAVTAIYAGGSVALDVKSGSLTLDEAWSPYCRASFECALPASYAAIDPRQPVTLNVYASRAAESGVVLSTLYADLVLRSRRIDHKAGTMTLGASSREALLQDFRHVDTTPNPALTTDLRETMQRILTASLTSGILAADGGQTGTVTAESTIWYPGVTAWDYAQPFLQKGGKRLWCDLDGLFHLTEAMPIVGGAINLSYLSTITEATETINRDDDEWADAVVITYKWTDASNAQRVAYDIAPPRPHNTRLRKVLALEYNTPYPGAGAAAQLLTRVSRRGRQQSISAISDYSARPGMACSFVIPDGTIQAGSIAAVAWTFPGSEMAVTSRELVSV